MKTNLVFSILLAFVFALFIIGKAYAQSTYPKVADIQPPQIQPVTAEHREIPVSNQKVSIWSKH